VVKLVSVTVILEKEPAQRGSGASIVKGSLFTLTTGRASLIHTSPADVVAALTAVRCTGTLAKTPVNNKAAAMPTAAAFFMGNPPGTYRFADHATRKARLCPADGLASAYQAARRHLI
jgi:hypothetical protein